MPRSFLVKKKAGVVGMPRPVSVCAPPGRLLLLPDPALMPTHNPFQGLACSNIFSPVKLCSSPTSTTPVTLRSDDLTYSCTPLTPERCPSTASSGCSTSSTTPEPINYSTSPRSAPGSPGGSLSPSWSCTTPASSPEPTCSPWGSASASPTGREMAHLPFLALSFKRLQEMHMKAVESRLQSITMSPQRHHQVSPPAAPGSPPTYGPALSPHYHQHQQQSVTSPSPTKVVPVPASPDSRCDPSPVMPRRTALPHHHDVSYWARSECLQGVPMDTGSVQEEAPRRRKDGDPPRYQCEACNKSYATFSGLSKHKQFHCTALIKKEFICKHCDKKYVSLGALKMHIRTHTLPCKCHICGKAFSRPWLLQGHVRTHTGEKPFPCVHCGRSFADRSNLRAHLQTHTDIKKYNCHSCSKSFSRSSLLHKHMDNGCGSASGVVRAL